MVVNFEDWISCTVFFIEQYNSIYQIGWPHFHWLSEKSIYLYEEMGFWRWNSELHFISVFMLEELSSIAIVYTGVKKWINLK